MRPALEEPPPRALDLRGRIFGRLEPLGYAGKNKHGKAVWLCRCRCSAKTELPVLASKLQSGHTQSCGCLHREICASRLRTHGHAGKRSTTYNIWKNMVSRCTNPNHPAYMDYGGRGIKVCRRWRRFENFLKDMGERPERLTVERRRNDKGYCAKNCYWGTWREQARNRRSNHLLTWRGEVRCLAEWADLVGIGEATIRARLAAGWSVEKALSFPVRKMKGRT